MSRISRRDFLKLSGLAAGAALLPGTPPGEVPAESYPLGRAIKQIYVYARPSLSADSVRRIQGEEVFPIVATVVGEEPNYNRLWYRVEGGFVYSGSVQPVRWNPQIPTVSIPAGGFLGEVTVPFTIARTGPYANWKSLYRLYYSTTVWITSARLVDGEVWYGLFDERLEREGWVLGKHLRRVTHDEIAPIAPNADKRIEIDLEQQRFQCYQDGRRVLDTLCSTGIYLRTENGKRIFGTPAGEFNINRKRLTRHMAGDDLAAADFFDLPGVPWVSYFHWWGVSIHGTYWHNDYGKPHSHGCINLAPETAKWVYRWSMPKPVLSHSEIDGKGTQVIVN